VSHPADLSRQAILAHPDAQDCTLYRPDPKDPDAEEQDLGDARILIVGPFQPPAEWDAREREDYFGDDDPAAFVVAHIACEAEPGSKGYCEAEAGDYVAVMAGLEVTMFYVHERGEGGAYVLIRDEEQD
jgi:hypothetical protein